MATKKPIPRAPGAGRPAADKKKPRNKRIEVCVSEADITQIDAKCKRGKKTRSTYIYDILKRALRRG